MEVERPRHTWSSTSSPRLPCHDVCPDLYPWSLLDSSCCGSAWLLDVGSSVVEGNGTFPDVVLYISAHARPIDARALSFVNLTLLSLINDSYHLVTERNSRIDLVPLEQNAVTGICHL